MILDVAKDIKTNFDPLLQINPYAYICGGGHANEFEVTGQKYDVLIDIRKPADLAELKGKYWHTVSCKFGQAKDTLLQAGVRAFCGAVEDYIFCMGDANNVATQ